MTTKFYISDGGRGMPRTAEVDELVDSVSFVRMTGAERTALSTATGNIGDLQSEITTFRTFVGKDTLAQTLPDYSTYTPGRYIAVGDSLRNATGKIDAALYAHAGLRGPSPVVGEEYHANKNQSDAWDDYGGYSPDATNPFATVDWVASQITSANIAMASGDSSDSWYAYLDYNDPGGPVPAIVNGTFYYTPAKNAFVVGNDFCYAMGPRYYADNVSSFGVAHYNNLYSKSILVGADLRIRVGAGKVGGWSTLSGWSWMAVQ
jgi:hypothetical protein